MEIKKQFIIKVLRKLKPYRNLAEGFLALVEGSYATDQTIDVLIVLLSEAIKTVKNDKEKTKFKESLQLIKKIRNKENNEGEKMSEDDLDKLLENI